MKHSKLLYLSLVVWITSLLYLTYIYLTGYGPWQKKTTAQNQTVQLTELAVGRSESFTTLIPDLRLKDITSTKVSCPCLVSSLTETSEGLEWSFTITPKVPGAQAPIAKLFVFGESSPKTLMVTGNAVTPIIWNKEKPLSLKPGENSITFKESSQIWPEGLSLKCSRVIGGYADVITEPQRIVIKNVQLDMPNQPVIQLLLQSDDPKMPWVTVSANYEGQSL